MIREALQRESLNKWQTVTKFIQNPPVADYLDKSEDERMDEDRGMSYSEY
jgi:hypothetical protein